MDMKEILFEQAGVCVSIEDGMVIYCDDFSRYELPDTQANREQFIADAEEIIKVWQREGTWYAVMDDENDSDWFSYGSFDEDTARDMLSALNDDDAYVAVIKYGEFSRRLDDRLADHY